MDVVLCQIQQLRTNEAYSDFFIELSLLVRVNYLWNGKDYVITVRPVPPGTDRYADRPLPGGSTKIGRRRSISVVDGRFPPSAVDLRRRRRGKEEEEEKKKNKKRSTSRCPSNDSARGSPASRRHPRCPSAIAARGFFSTRAGRRNVSPRGENSRRHRRYHAIRTVIPFLLPPSADTARNRLPKVEIDR
ncbi:hypothetical protein BHE74_00023442 [Ensete ventricosum]|nr:hypothetical protein BHE74_00023442 [Ensete ventricosum]